VALQLRPVNKSDIPALKGFYGRFDRADTCLVREDFFEWQFIRPCELAGRDDLAFLAAFDGDEVVAVSVACQGRFLIGGRPTGGCWHHEWLSLQGGAGFFLMRHQSENNEFLGIVGQNLEAALSFSRIRPSTWVELERLFAVANPERAARSVFDATELTLPYLRRCVIPPPASDVGIETLDSFGDDYDELWGSLRGRFSLVQDRDAGFMNWRYVDHPIFTYDIFACRSPQGPAYYVLRREEVTDSEGVVARMCDVIGEADAIAATYPAVHARMQEFGVAFVDFFCTNQDVNAALSAAGMHPLVVVPGLDLGRLFQPFENRIQKRINFCFSFGKKVVPKGIFAYHRSYVTRGDGNQDSPIP
jgi:hypothetical protein